jgi:hypothetical protein
LSNIDKAKREVSVSELGQIKDKYPDMVQRFEVLKEQANQPQNQGLWQTNGQSVQQQLQNVVQQEQRRLQNQGQNKLISYS